LGIFSILFQRVRHTALFYRVSCTGETFSLKTFSATASGVTELEAADVAMTQLVSVQTKLPLLQRDSLLTMETLHRSDRATESDETHPKLLKLSLSMIQVEKQIWRHYF